MNLDYQKENWLQSTYRLCSLTKMVQNICDTNNFSQIAKQPTRTMYNSISGVSEISCLDHIYTNARHKCSSANVMACGASDHDVVCFTRYSKSPPAQSRVIVRRSYRQFVKNDFLADMESMDWSDVYVYRDVDDAVCCFTAKFNVILNKHAPWIRYQKRKHYSPGISSKTLELMK